MIDKLKYVGVLSIAVLTMGHGASAQDSTGVDLGQKNLIGGGSIYARPIAQLPPVESPSDKLKPTFSNFPTPSADLPSDKLKPTFSNWPTPVEEVTEIKVIKSGGIRPAPVPYEHATTNRDPVYGVHPKMAPIVENELPSEEFPIYGSVDPETGGVIISHSPGVIGTPVYSNFPTPSQTPAEFQPENNVPIIGPPQPVEGDDAQEINPTNTIRIKGKPVNVSPAEMERIKTSLKRVDYARSDRMISQKQKPIIQSYSPSGWNDQ